MGCFDGGTQNDTAMFCKYLLFYLLLPSTLLLFLFSFISVEKYLERMLGLSFLNQYYPISNNGLRGVKPFLVFGFTFFTVLFVEYISFEWGIHFYNKDVILIKKEDIILHEKGYLSAVNKK